MLLYVQSSVELCGACSLKLQSTRSPQVYNVSVDEDAFLDLDGYSMETKDDLCAKSVWLAIQIGRMSSISIVYIYIFNKTIIDGQILYRFCSGIVLFFLVILLYILFFWKYFFFFLFILCIYIHIYTYIYIYTFGNQ